MNIFQSYLGISTITVVKPAAGFCYGISVTTAGVSGGGVYDAGAVSGTVPLGSQFATIPTVTGMVLMPHVGWPCEVGITVVPGSGQVLSVAFS